MAEGRDARPSRNEDNCSSRWDGIADSAPWRFVATAVSKEQSIATAQAQTVQALTTGNNV